MIELLWKLTCRPEDNWNRINTALIFIKFFISGEEKTRVSSAYCKWDTFDPARHISIPSHRPNEIDFWNRRLKGSTARLKRKGDRGSPCLRPRYSLKKSEGEPLIKIAADADIVQERIHSLHFNGKFICSITQSRYFQETLSNALWKSSFIIIASDLLFLHVSIISLAINAPSNICLPFIKEDCWGPINKSMTFCRRLANIFAMTL